MSRIFLIGMMGAGKTTVGRILASRLDCPYLDSDEEVEAATGFTVPELFAKGGEPAFRVLETEALTQACAIEGPVVVSVAGGAVLDPANRVLLKSSGAVVWLRADPATLIGRVGTGAGRPLLDDGPADAITRLEAVRRPLYAEIADVVVDVDRRDAQAVADYVLEALPA